ncbi:MAG: T9SS type A sorting domain-containing protein [Bacteroidales bacterium]|nr:T9SS type A sorting domain-containing protein [Bacteroidales bacterium]
MKRPLNIIFLTILLALCATTLSAQEVLTGLSVNKPVARAAQSPRAEALRNPLHLPFVEDFSNYTGLPDPSRWQDRYAYVNRSFALRPPTLGVATLDVLDENGRVYERAANDGFRADALTSLPIRLDYNFTNNSSIHASDSVYLSFYYQPAGGSLSGLEWERLGNRPEAHDSLILEFGYATGNIVFAGYEYCDYFLGDDEMYIAGDTLFNPFIPGLFYIFEGPAFPGDLIPMPCDSLFEDEMIWEHIWSAPGELLDNWLAENDKQYFKQVMIPITDSRWFIDNFQFRFRNLASMEDNGIVGWAGNVDQWNIDYIRLDVNRTHNDLYPNDLAFVMPTTSILREYQAMPWSQYRDSELDNHFENALVNLSNNVKNSYYTYNIRKVGGSQVANYTPNNENAQPYWEHGLHDASVHATPPFQFSSLPTDNADSATFTITHIFQEVGAGSQMRCNDTCIFQQKFSNFYAYDDGTAEAGYSILSNLTNPVAYFAMRFSLNQPDTLRCVRMWFNSVLDDANIADFTLMVWDDDNGLPGEVLYEAEHQLPKHGQQYEDFANYYIDEPLAVEGSFYVGFFQNHATQLNLGFDQNTDSRAHWVYRVGSNWQEPFLKGTPMIRAVVGAPIDHSGVIDHQIADCSLYPNPAGNTIHAVVPDNLNGISCRIFDSYGRLLAQYTLQATDTEISIQNLPSGIYLMQFCNNQQIIRTEKFIKQ